MEWKPIETAPPTTGVRQILLTNGEWVKMGWWGPTTYDRKTKSYRRGWVSGADELRGTTHWMPLPDPPHPVERKP